MDEKTQKELLEAAQKALAIIAISRKHKDFVFELRDLIRRIKGNGPD